MGKFEHLNGFKKIVWVPGMARDQKIAKKYLKIANIVNLEGKMLKISNKSVFKKAKYQFFCKFRMAPLKYNF